MQQIPEKLVQFYSFSPERRHALYRRTLAVVIISQIFGGAGLAAGVTVGALLAQQMLGTAGLAGIPAALFTLGSAGAAFLVGRISQSRGRRAGLASGFIAGGIGAAGVVLAAVTDSVVLLFIALLVYGAGTATNLQARYAGTDLAPPQRRATAVSLAMVSTTLGAVAGPNLVTPMGAFATALGIPALAGPFLLASVAYAFAGLVLYFWMRPDPLLLATAISAQDRAETAPATDSPSTPEPPGNNRGVAVGTTVMVLTQIAMVAIMTMTPVHMQSHGHGLTEVGVVIGIHIGFMYLPSLITGVDRLGRVPMAVAAGVTLLAAGILAATAPAQSMGQLMIALALLGLGWNFGLISGTALIVDATPLETRAKIQGSIDVLIALAGATGGALSGVVVAGASYAVLSLAGGVLSLLLIPVVVWSQRTTPRN
ncbi:MFS transporter [Pseudarthrobacter raffinosi]|uniref:MFS transporter n=1 Tax=Pseudarthrobacter raffinosi TaxID=2953651 RepID=UPI00208E171A|nr:MFS transporter [Pseudarthrobacter sp. MDT3-9]MCO4252513.1 MFS transporter [Pseudarthrobacter sp. MDT3-9]